jgi:acetyl esterase/lipase
LDIYTPEARTQGRRPVVVWIHGGGWFSGDKADPSVSNKIRVLTASGFIVVSVNYRLSPDLAGSGALAPGRLRFPKAQVDVARAFSWVRRNVGAYGGDPSRIIVGGQSAGGQLAALLAVDPGYLSKFGLSNRAIRGVLALDPVALNLRPMATQGYAEANPGFQRMIFNAFGTPGEETARPTWDKASAVRFADPGDPPMYMVVSGRSRLRVADKNRILRGLAQRPGLVSGEVPLPHRGVVSLFGHPDDDLGTTRPVIRFARAAIKSQRLRPPRVRVVRYQGGRVRVSIETGPRARLVTCRVDGGPERSCPRHRIATRKPRKLVVLVYGDTGRMVGSRTVRLESAPNG